MRKTTLLTALLGASVMLGSLGSANALTLADLLGGETVTAGDKVFSGFTYVNVAGGMPDASAIAVTTSTSGLDVSIRFSGAFGDPTDDGSPETALIGYQVDVVNPTGFNNNITGVSGLLGTPMIDPVPPDSTGGHLTAVKFVDDNPAIDTSAGGSPRIINATTWLADGTVIADGAFTGTFPAALFPADTLYVLDRILAQNAGGAPSTDFIENTFIQESIPLEVVPEPGTVALLIGMGISGGLLALRRRR